MEIPKIIHQSWKDNNIPENIYKKEWIESWLQFNPDWIRLFWTDDQNEELVKDFYPEFYNFYLTLTPNIKKADFCRFLYMHKYGGVYVDLDFVCLKNLSPLLIGHELVLGCLSSENEFYQIPNAFIASTSGLDFWIQTAKDAMNAPDHEQTVEKHAGPFRLQWAYNKYQPSNAVVYGHELIYPFDWINFVGWRNGKYYRQDLVDLARLLQTKSTQEISTYFPKAYCLTFWVHNW